LVLLAPLLALGVVAACDGAGSDPPTPPSCSSSADCSSGMVCEFAVTGPAACGAQGQCAYAAIDRCAGQPVCTCQGETTTTCVIGGYVVGNPVRSLGACDAGADAGSTTPTDAGADASAD
jgi:hypothetical protein